MDHIDILATARDLQAQGRPHALVSVLRVQPPASARPGDKAIVTADGIVQGWIGGGCAQPAVLKTVRHALADGRARVIRIAPAEEGQVRELGDVLEFGMACHSGGTLELFVDPLLPRARLVVVGDTPLAAALAALAPRVGLPVTVVAHGAEAARFPDADQVVARDEGAEAEVAPGAFVVVATQGRRDLPGLRAALALQARQVFFVASARKAQVLKAQLVESGADPAAVQAIVAPAGQPIGAQTPEEIALSVLAAVVAARRGRGAAAGAAPAPDGQADQADQAGSVTTLAAGVATPPPAATGSASCCAGRDATTATAVRTEALTAGAAAPPSATPARSRLSALLAKLPAIDLPPGRGGCCGG